MDQRAGYSVARPLSAGAGKWALPQLDRDRLGLTAAVDLELDVLPRVVGRDHLGEVVGVLDRRAADLGDHVAAGAERGRLEAGLLIAAADASAVGGPVGHHVLHPGAVVDVE